MCNLQLNHAICGLFDVDGCRVIETVTKAIQMKTPQKTKICNSIQRFNSNELIFDDLISFESKMYIRWEFLIQAMRIMIWYSTAF